MTTLHNRGVYAEREDNEAYLTRRSLELANTELRVQVAAQRRALDWAIAGLLVAVATIAVVAIHLPW